VLLLFFSGSKNYKKPPKSANKKRLYNKASLFYKK